MKRFTEELDFCSNTVPIFEQLTLAKFINEGYFERHINRIKKIYRDRRDKLISTLKNKLPHNSFSVEGENSGLHFLLRLNSSADEYEFVKAASDIGIRVHGLSEYYQCSEKYNGNPCVVIGYAQLNSNDIENAASLLADSWRKLGLV
jgi:GntR family transcriptional regulator/MocR family aminotransferase